MICQKWQHNVTLKLEWLNQKKSKNEEAGYVWVGVYVKMSIDHQINHQV